MNATLWPEYEKKGAVFWGIGSDDPFDSLSNFQEQMSIDFPILYDENAEVHNQYAQQLEYSNTKYPQEWVIGVDGTVVYISSDFDPATLTAVLDAELAKMP